MRFARGARCNHTNRTQCIDLCGAALLRRKITGATCGGIHESAAMHIQLPRDVAALLQRLTVLVIEDNSFTRKVNRALLGNIGVKTVHEVADGVAGLEAIRTTVPDLVVVDWDLPQLTGAELVKMVRSPDTFPLPDVPIIMLTSHAERRRVLQAQQLGVHEFLVKPISGKVMLERIVSIFRNPRPMVRIDKYYGPQPRGALESALRKMAEKSSAAELQAGAA
jgi:two-component system chemotaxis response regulator CheY